MDEFKAKLLELQKEFRPCKFAEEDAMGRWPFMKHYSNAYAEQLYAKKPKRVLEIGVQFGGSLKMWEKLFEAEVHGIDCDPNCKRHEGGRRHVWIGSQSDTNFLLREVVPHARIRIGAFLLSDVLAAQENAEHVSGKRTVHRVKD